jgi:hypothetical protein
MIQRIPWNHTGDWADIIASYKDGKMLPSELLPDADCENCEHRMYDQEYHCYIFRERPGDKCAQFKARQK